MGKSCPHAHMILEWHLNYSVESFNTLKFIWMKVYIATVVFAPVFQKS